MMSFKTPGPVFTFAARHGAPALFAGGLLMLLLAGWRMVPAGIITSGISTLPAAAEDGRPTLLVLYQAKDCQSYGRFLGQWNMLAREGEVRVVGVPLNTRREDAGAPVLDFFTPAFPVRADLANGAATLLRQMGQSRSPTAVLLDGSGRPLMVIPPSRYPRQDVQARMAVRDYARAMFPLSPSRNRS